MIAWEIREERGMNYKGTQGNFWGWCKCLPWLWWWFQGFIYIHIYMPKLNGTFKICSVYCTSVTVHSSLKIKWFLLHLPIGPSQHSYSSLKTPERRSTLLHSPHDVQSNATEQKVESCMSQVLCIGHSFIWLIFLPRGYPHSLGMVLIG